MKVSCSPPRAASRAAGPRPRRAGRRATTVGRRGPRGQRELRKTDRETGAPRGRWPSRRADRPAARSSRARAARSVAGGDRLRRRLSRIFQRAMSGRRLRVDAGARRHERKQPPQDLPVAAHPAVLPPRVREHARGIVVHDLDVADQRRPRVEAFEQVVRQQRVLGHAAVERRRERVDVVQALAGEDALAEQVLVDVGDGRGVRIDAGVAGVDPGEERSGRARHRHADARLEDAVAGGDAAEPRDRPAAWFSGCAMMPMRRFAASRGRRVSESSVRQ